jgi:hypothetical protein
MRIVYAVNVPMADSDHWFRVCECENPENAAEMVKALLNTNDRPPLQVRVDKIIYPEG